MKALMLAIFAAITLAACGGGSSGGGITPNPGPSYSPAHYAAKVYFVGKLAGAQSAMIRPAISDMAAPSSPAPVMIVSASEEDCIANMNCVTNPEDSFGGQVVAQVSPAPPTNPAVSFTQNAPHTLLSPTPSPAPSATPQPEPTGVVGVQAIMGDGTLQVQASGTVSVSIGTPANVIATTQVYQYYRVDITDGIAPHPGQYQGWAFDGSKWVGDNDPTTADIYVTCDKCTGAFGVPNDSSTLHFPGGGTFISNDNTFAWVTAAQFANTYSALALNTIGQFNPDGSTNSLLIAKTRGLFNPSVAPAIFKVFPLGTSNACAGDCGFVGAIETSGAGVDGF